MLCSHAWVTKRCPGCSNLIHLLCSCVLEQLEGSNVDGKCKWYESDSVVCMACDPKTPGTSYTTAEKDSEAEYEVDGINKGSEKNNTSSDEDDDSNNGNNEDMNHVEEKNSSNMHQHGALKCSYRKCGKSYFNDDVWALLPCDNFSCKKKIHCLCFEHFLSALSFTFR